MHHGIGRRKSATARVWLKSGSGAISVNGVDYTKYFDTDVAREALLIPLNVTGKAKNFDVVANVQGGGRTGQSDAIKLGISRALLTTDESLRLVLRENDLLTVDSRVKNVKNTVKKLLVRNFNSLSVKPYEFTISNTVGCKPWRYFYFSLKREKCQPKLYAKVG